MDESACEGSLQGNKHESEEGNAERKNKSHKQEKLDVELVEENKQHKIRLRRVLEAS